MALYRCNRCGHLSEHGNELAGQRMACPACQTDNAIYPTVPFVQTLLERYFAVRRELRQTQHDLEALRTQTPEPADSTGALSLPMDFDPGNTDLFCSKLQLAPVIDWFRQRQIEADLDPRSLDTSGHFDEISAQIGRDYGLLGELVERIRMAQKQEFSFINLDLSRRSPEQAQQLREFCRTLVRCGLIGRSTLQDGDVVLRLPLVKQPAVRRFFDGDWLVWFGMMQTLRHLVASGIEFSVARDVSVSWPRDDGHVIDLFFLVGGQRAVVMQCRIGDPALQMERLAHLRERLGIVPDDYLLLACDLTDRQVESLQQRHGLSIATPQTLAATLTRRFSA
jgi:hypothetical protein